MEQRIVDIATSDGVDPGEVGVLSFVVVQRARAEIPEASQHRNQEDQAVRKLLDAQSSRLPQSAGAIDDSNAVLALNA